MVVVYHTSFDSTYVRHLRGHFILYLVSQIVFHLSRHIKFAAGLSVGFHLCRISRSSLRTDRSGNWLGGEHLVCSLLFQPRDGVEVGCIEIVGMVRGSCHRSNIFPPGSDLIHSVTHNLKYCNSSKHVIHIISTNSSACKLHICCCSRASKISKICICKYHSRLYEIYFLNLANVISTGLAGVV